MKNAGLGRGLGALLGEEALRDTSETGSLSLRLAQVEPNATQPRRVFDEVALSELADSIRQNGILQPLLVRRLDSGYYQIIAGERRWRAARLAGLSEVPAIVVEADDRRAMELALIENLQREDLNPLEEAQGYRSLMDDFGLTQEEAAERVGRSRPAVANSLRLLSLNSAVQDLLLGGALSAGHARALLSLPEESQEKAARQVIEQALSVRQTEALCRRLMGKKKARPAPLPYFTDYERELASAFGRKVSIVSTEKRGKLTLEFYGADDFDRLMALLRRMGGTPGADM